MADYETSDEYKASMKKLEMCKAIKDKEGEIDCMFKLLHNITTAQDIVNISILKTIDDSEDPRWIPTHMIDNANAIILGISRNKGYPKNIVPMGGYVDEKMDSLDSKWHTLIMKHRK